MPATGWRLEQVGVAHHDDVAAAHHGPIGDVHEEGDRCCSDRRDEREHGVVAARGLLGQALLKDLGEADVVAAEGERDQVEPALARCPLGRVGATGCEEL